MSDRISTASLKAVKGSPTKVMRVTKNIVGKSVSEVLKLLRFSNLRLAPTLRALVYSAMSNAENNHNLDTDVLYVKDVDVGRAFALKRSATRGRGKSSRILKTFSKVRVILAEKELSKS